MKTISWLLASLALAALLATQPVLAQSEDDAPATEQEGEDADDDRRDPADDIFLPSEEIQADTEISFPSDI